MAREPSGKPPGRPEHQRTPEGSNTVRALTAYGIPQDRIAGILGISEPTLRKHYWREIETGLDEANAAVAESLFNVATKGTGKERVTACIFWLKTRAGWIEGVPPEPPGKKQLAALAAREADKDTEWEGLLN